MTSVFGKRHRWWRVQESKKPKNCKSSVYMISFKSGLGRPPCNFRDNWDNCNCAFPFWENNIPNFQIHTEVHFHQVANETYLSIFGHGFQAPGTTPFQRWRLAPHCAERQRYWLVSTMAVQNGIFSASPWPCLDLFWPIPHDKFEVWRLWLCAGNLNWNKFTQRSWRLRKQRFGLQSLSSWENTIPFSSSFLRCTQGHFLYMFVWWKADGGCLVV